MIGRALAAAALALALAGCATAPPTFHRAYDAAARRGAEPRRGVVLHLHGCDGMGRGGFHEWQRPWASHFERSGFLLIVPDSFADPRPAVSCAPPFPNKLEIYTTRRTQTLHAIAKIREAYPGAKLIVWGHSEGGGVANMIDDRVDGIITTGYQCGYRGTRQTSIRVDVPLLAIMGTADPFLAFVKPSIEEHCRAVFKSPRWRAVVIQGMKHAAPLDVPQVRRALDEFLASVAP